MQLEGMIEDLKDYIYQDEQLYFYCRELAYNFEWVFNLCSVLSPVIEDRGLQPKHSFKCLHTTLCDASEEAKYYPCYAISVSQFMKVLSKIETKLAQDELVKMAERIDCLDFHKEHGHFIYYDKFLVAVRNATLSKEEILHLEKIEEEEVEKQVVSKSEAAIPSGPGKEQYITKIVAYNLIPIFENADYFDQKDFIEANPDATLAKIILSIHKQTNHIKFIHFTYKLKNGQLHNFEVGKPLLNSTLDLVHFTIDINNDEFLTGVRVSNFHTNNANRVVNYLSILLNTHPDGIAYGQFVGHPGELKSVTFDPAEYGDKKILGFYGAFRDDLVGLGVYMQERELIKPPPPPEEEAKKVF